MSGIFFSAILVAFGLFQALALPLATAQENQPVKLRFAGAVNGIAFACGKNYSNIGTDQVDDYAERFQIFRVGSRAIDPGGQSRPFDTRPRRHLAI